MVKPGWPDTREMSEFRAKVKVKGVSTVLMLCVSWFTVRIPAIVGRIVRPVFYRSIPEPPLVVVVMSKLALGVWVEIGFRIWLIVMRMFWPAIGAVSAVKRLSMRIVFVRTVTEKPFLGVPKTSTVVTDLGSAT